MNQLTKDWIRDLATKTLKSKRPLTNWKVSILEDIEISPVCYIRFEAILPTTVIYVFHLPSFFQNDKYDKTEFSKNFIIRLCNEAIYKMEDKSNEIYGK